MNRTILTLSAASIAAVCVLPTTLYAGTQPGGERWDGFIDMNGEKTPIHLRFELGAGETIRGQIATFDEAPKTLENVAIVGNTVYFNISEMPGNPTFKGTISSDGLSVAGTYSQNGDHYSFDVTYVEEEETPRTAEVPGGAVVESPTAADGSATVAAAAVAAAGPAEAAITLEIAPAAVEPVAVESAKELWNGTIRLPDRELRVELAFVNHDDGTIGGEISIPEQDVRDWAVSTFTINGNELSFEIPGIPGQPRFVGTITEDGRGVVGEFVQTGMRAPFALAYVDDGKNRTEAPAGGTLPLAEPAVSLSEVVSTNRWEGVIELPGERVVVQLDFFGHADQRITGDITLPGQNSFDLPLTEVVITETEVTFGIAGVPGSPRFTGVIGADGTSVAGTFTHHGAKFPFSLRYVKPGQLAAAALGRSADSIGVVGEADSSMGMFAAPKETAEAAPAAAPAPAEQAVEAATGPERWEGVIEIPGQRLEVQLDFRRNADDTLSGDITIPAQNAVDLPLENIKIDEYDFTASIKDVPGSPTFRGRIHTDLYTVSGEFEQNGLKFPFTLTYVGSPSQASLESLEGFTTWADEARQAWHAPGLAVAIIKGDKVIFAEGLGTRDLDGGAAVTAETMFAIGSCSKAFTTFVLGTLVDEGKLDWDKPVRDYIPTFKMSDERSTEHLSVRDMVTHRSGLPRHDMMWYNSDFSRADMVTRLASLQPNKELRQSWQYNNLMFLTAGCVVEQITGKTWEENVKARVFLPLAMNGADFSVAEMQKTADFAYPYERRDEKMRKMPFRDISLMGPAGSINAGVNDMGNWVIANLNGGAFKGQQIISPVTLTELQRPQMVMPGTSIDPEVINVGYAMGWFVSAYRGHLMVSHGGNIDGFSALVTLLPNDKIGVVALTNMNGSPLPKLATYHALDRLLGAESKDWNAAALAKNAAAEKMEKEGEANKELTRKQGTSPSHAIAEYAGEFENSGYGVLAVAADGEALAISFNKITAPLNHWHYDTFVAGKNEADPALEDRQLQFRTSLAGDIDAVLVSLEPSVAPIVFERRADAQLTDAAYLAKFAGEYQLGPQTLTIDLKGGGLVAVLAGQPPYELVPTREDTFKLKGLNGFSVKFITESGAVQSAQLNQPNGVFVAHRK